ncbi:hypothetical protein [Novosphingobium sp. KN65.2]|uniref:hypothetical protein n=1 Tax=Novosphingobium sp. KN65.2 TaxID=1478134 RepID=UPI0005E59B80|nr:hypothetical protein [Novosphingobium sp. KN65.2]CDO35055.1 hypothetical protein SPHV1_2180067 [Novosphingobium sp. KN65.2]
MLHCPAENLVFVHVPKNAGKSVRHALSRHAALSWSFLARDLGVSEARAERAMDEEVDVPGLGRVKPAHLPLPIMAMHFPQTWVTIRSARSFILTRPPRDRFFSALLQRLGEFADMRSIRADDPRVRQEAERVCAWLEGRGVFADVEYIHFSRQVDYADRAGKRIVSALFPLDRIGSAAQWLSNETGLHLEFAHDHARREPRKWAGALQPAARLVGRRVLPLAVKKAIYPLWMNSGLFADAAGRYEAIDLGPDVERFISDYYAADARLHAEAVTFAERQDLGAVA